MWNTKNVAPKNTQTRANIHPDQHVTCSEISMKSHHFASFPAPWWFLPPSRTACFALVTSASSSSPSHGMASPSNRNPSSELFAVTVVVIRTYHSKSSKKTSNISAYPQKSHQSRIYILVLIDFAYIYIFVLNLLRFIFSTLP